MKYDAGVSISTWTLCVFPLCQSNCGFSNCTVSKHGSTGHHSVGRATALILLYNSIVLNGSIYRTAGGGGSQTFILANFAMHSLSTKIYFAKFVVNCHARWVWSVEIYNCEIFFRETGLCYPFAKTPALHYYMYNFMCYCNIVYTVCII